MHQANVSEASFEASTASFHHEIFKLWILLYEMYVFLRR